MSTVVHVSLEGGVTLKLTVPPTATGSDVVEAAQKKLFVAPSPHHSLQNSAGESVELGQAVGDNKHYKLVCSPDAPILSVLAVTRSPEPFADLLANASEADLFTPDSSGCTALHYAAGNPEILSLLLEKNTAEIDRQDALGRTPIMRAAAIGCLESVELLRTAGATVTQLDNQGRNFLHYFCMGAPLDEETLSEPLFDWIVQEKFHPFIFDQAGYCPAHYASENGNCWIVRRFVNLFNFPLDLATNNESDTCLHLAARNDHIALVTELMQNGANPYCANHQCELPIDYALMADHAAMLGVLADPECISEKELWALVRDGEVSSVLQAVEERLKSRKKRTRSKKSSSRSKDTEKSEASEASESTEGKKRRRRRKGRGTSSQHLLNTVILWAAARMRLDLLDALLDLPQANTSFTCKYDLSVLNIMCQYSEESVFTKPEYVKLLDKIVAKGDNVNTRPATTGITCIHTAALNGNLPALKFCLDHGAFTSCVNTLSMSELHFAILSAHEEAVKQLLLAGSDPSMLLAGGKNCADFAGLVGQTAIQTLLQQAESSEASQIQQNVAVITFTRATDLLAKDDNNLSDPYVVFRHQCGDLFYKDKTDHILETLNPEWTTNNRFYLVIRKDGVLYRDIPIQVYDWDDVDSADQMAVDDLIGRATIILDPRRGDRDLELPLHDAEGYAGTLYASVHFVSMPDVDGLLKEKYEKHNPLKEARDLMKALDLKSVGKAKAQLGYKPKYPVMIIPGFASSALECWEGERSGWFRERIWLDPLKVGHTVVGATLKSMTSGSKKLDVNERRWLRHLLPDTDGWSDPEGIKLRPVPGLHGTDFLVEAPLAKNASYVNGFVIEQLGHVGYDSSNLDAATFDWRIPPQKLEERDGYFSQLKSRIQFMRERNGERVVLMAHSMGNRCAQYFLAWLAAHHPGWTDQNIHAFLAMGPPFLGATKPVRAVISGDCCGLEAFLTLEEGRLMHRGLGSVPWLLPIHEEHFPDRIISRVRSANAVPQPKKGLLSSIRGKSSSKKIEREPSLTNTQPSLYDGYHTNDILERDAPSILQYKRDYYESDPLYLKKEEGEALPTILRPPQVDNLWVIMGINLATEVCYYYKPVSGADGETRLDLDSAADAYSHKKDTGVNPRGFKISGGIGFETKTTFQPSVGVNKSGDGTVPYCSLNLAESSWRKYAQQNNLPIKIQTFEIDGAEHREMLNNAAVSNCILDLVCVKPIG